MYTLTLTHDERRAIDWIGDRYRHGVELCDLLAECPATGDGDDMWNGNDDITYTVPEHVAWQIGDIVREGLDCFSPALVAKLTAFADAIV